MTTEIQNVVVVGGGAAGTMICRKLSTKLDPRRHKLILVTARPYYTHLPPCIRMVVTPQGALENQVHIPYDTLFTGKRSIGRVVIAKVVGVDENDDKKGGKVRLDSGETIDFAVLVVATGCTWEGPLNFPDGREELEKWLAEWRDRFCKAEDVVIVGGGSVGIEFAGEIRDLSPTKRITIVHDQSLLLNDAYPDSFRKLAAKNIRKRDVEIILDDAIHDLGISDASTIRTAKGRLLVADLVIPCRGPRPNTSFLAGLEDGPINHAGYVHVIPTLQVWRHPRILAAGDIIDRDEQKQLQKYPYHADVVVRNVLDILKGRQPEALYKGCYERIVISNGKVSVMSSLGSSPFVRR
ncbi:hypothetical protein CC2G_002967 [Coprinopsis cinerea AmutBmut pab1-1]|nr:hypothetical protein CC2G_002967 [Coprinopsis cinerea AmutBmut pab1-1]